MTNEQRKIMQLSDAILDIVDSAEDMTRSDLQGVVEALAINVIKGLK